MGSCSRQLPSAWFFPSSPGSLIGLGVEVSRRLRALAAAIRPLSFNYFLHSFCISSFPRRAE
jgi:hypothetical protein